MHPLLERGRRLFLYLSLFAPVAVLLAELLRLTVGGGRFALWVLVQPPLLVHAMTCLAAWYLCRSLPLRNGDLLRLAGAQLMAMLLAAALFLLLTRVWSGVLASFGLELAGVVDQGAALIGLFAFFVYALAVVGHYLYIALQASREAESHALELRLLAQDSELRALRAQLDPHFLFNSLNSVAGLVGVEPEKARAMCVSLAAFLRQSLRSGQQTMIPFRDELSLIESYLAVEKIRFGARLRAVVRLGGDAEDPARCLLPPLLLQPLVENAVRHGIAHRLDGGEVLIEARRTHERLLLVVANDCDADRPRAVGGGLGLRNVAGRLNARYGGEASLRVTEGSELFRVEITIPVEGEAS
jgi:two-component system sensor histidine kinase AlgZ